MPSSLHEAPLAALREYPELLIHIVRERLGTQLPADVKVREQPQCFTEAAIEEYRADAVFLIEDKSGQVLVVIIVEVQRQPQKDKPFRWLRYAARVHDDYRCETHLLVIATDEETARWAQRPISTFLPGRAAAGNAPVVLSPANLPKVASIEEARQKPGQAILAALLHAGADGDIEGCYRTLRALHDTAPNPEEALDRIWWLLGLLGGILPLERFTELQRLIMLNPEMKFVPRTEFDSPPYYRGKAEGRAEGEAKGEAKALLRVLAARNLSPTEEQQQAVLSCLDQAQLERWLDAAVTAPSIAALFSAK
jgi:hypothetical protein